jgi:hypothetical protein
MFYPDWLLDRLDHQRREQFIVPGLDPVDDA